MFVNLGKFAVLRQHEHVTLPEGLHIIIIIRRKFITRTQSSMNHESEARQSPGGRTEYVVNELGYEVRLEVALEAV